MIKLTFSRLTSIILTAVGLGMAFVTMLNCCHAGKTLFIVISAIVLGIETVLLQFLISDTKNNKDEEEKE